MKKLFLGTSPLCDGILSLISLLLRLSVSGAMLTHGIAKIQAFDKLSTTFPDPIGLGHLPSLLLAIGAEFGGSIFLIFGLLTRLALIPLMFTMGVVVFVVSAGSPFAAKELALIYLLVYVAIFALGAGRYSLDRLIFKK